MVEIERQYEQSTNTIKTLQAQMEAECSAAAKEAKVDLGKYNCDLDQLMFVAKPAAAKVEGAKAEPAKIEGKDGKAK